MINLRHLGLLCALTALNSAAVANDYEITLGEHRFDPLQLQQRAMHWPNASGFGFHLVQFNRGVEQRDVDQLRQAAVKALQPYPGNAYLVWGATGDLETLRGNSRVRAIAGLPQAFRIEPGLLKRQGTQQLAVHFFAADVEATLGSLEQLGAAVLRHHKAQPDGKFYNAIIEFPINEVDAIAAIPEVLWVEYSSPTPGFEDEMSDQIIADQSVGGVPPVGYEAFLSGLGYDGDGVIWSVIDSGVDYAHPDLINRITGGYSYPGSGTVNDGDDTPGGGHGTHVAGIIAGDATTGLTDGDGFLYGLGVAPGAGIFAQNPLSGSEWPPMGGWQELSKQGIAGSSLGANNSWTTGEGTMHGYQASERTFDFMIRDGDFDTAMAEAYVMVFSAGNSGNSGLTAPKEAKNVIVTASSNNFRAGDIDAISGFSSRGPAVDGRWVPTVAAPGASIASTKRVAGASQCGNPIAGTSSQYSFCSGTSMAAPHVSGAAVLLTDWYRDTAGEGADPSPALLKALLINGAVDLGTPDIPNINEGFGRVSVPRSLGVDANVVTFDQDHVIGLLSDPAEQLDFVVGIEDESEPLVVTLVWTDAPGAVGANPALINDLDLVIDSGGSTYFGNDMANGVSQTGGSADRLNNIEHAVITSPGPSATISVQAFALPGDGVPGVGDETDQDFALVCRNCTLNEALAMNVSPAVQSVCQPDDALFNIDVVGIGGLMDSASLSATMHPAGTSASFSVDPVDTGDSSVLTLSGTGGAALGSSVVEVTATGTSMTVTDTATLTLVAAAPAMPTLMSPADAAGAVALTPTFEWSAVADTDGYLLEIATDPAFTTTVQSIMIDGTETSFELTESLDSNTEYYWRLTASNACGDGDVSDTFSFTTQPLPGECPIDQAPIRLHSYTFEVDDEGWTHDGTGDTWVRSQANPHTGSFAWHADNVSSVSDQRLTSPVISLAAEYAPLTLQFWNYQALEDQGGTACYDGGILEISTDGGMTFQQIGGASMATDPYDGEINSGFDNPLSGLQAWCGDPQAYLNSVVDINSFAGDDAQFRFRLGTDNTVSRPGWDIDDVKIMGCGPDLIFADGVEPKDG